MSQKDMEGLPPQFKNTSIAEFKEALCPLLKGLADEMEIIDVVINDKMATVTVTTRDLDTELFADILKKLMSEHELYSSKVKEEDVSKILLDTFKKIDVKDILSKDITTVTVTLSFQIGVWLITDDSDLFSVFR